MKQYLLIISLLFSAIGFSQTFERHDVSNFDDVSGNNFLNKVATADLDNDGDIDLVTTGDEVTVYQNTGRAKFNITKYGKGFSTSSYQSHYTTMIFDYNNDGLKDIMSDIDKIYFFKNTGNCHFVLDTAITYDTAAYHVFNLMDTLDVNNDGKPDIVAGLNYNASSYTNIDYMTVSYNLGNGRFTKPVKLVNISSTSQFSGTKIIDIDTNGFKDMCLIKTSGSILAIMNNGNNTFTTKTYSQFSFDVADADNDGDVDGLFVNTSLQFVRNNGNGTYTNLIVDTVPYISFARFADIDGDNKPDILCGKRSVGNDNNLQNNLIYYKNLGGNSFSKRVIDTTINMPFANAFVADIDNDNKKDIIGYESSIVFYYNMDNINFKKEWAIHIGTYSYSEWVDMDMDGLKDYVYSFGRNAKLFWMRNKGKFEFYSPQALLEVLPSPDNVVLHVDDMNHDGLNDIYGCVNGKEIYALNAGNTTFPVSRLMDSANLSIVQSPTYDGFSDDYTTLKFVDINNDNVDDIIYTANDSVFYRASLPAGNFSKYYKIPNIYAASNRTFYMDLVVKDVDRDNRDELIYYPDPADVDMQLMPYKNNSNLTFTQTPFKTTSNTTISYSSLLPNYDEHLRFEDINNDTFPDLITNNNWMPSQSNGQYATLRSLVNGRYTPTLPYDPEFADLNNDGKKDLVMHTFTNGSSNDSLVYHLNTGNGVFESKSNRIDVAVNGTPPIYYRKRFFDIDNDNDIDIAYTLRYPKFSKVVVFENKINDKNTIAAQCYWDQNQNGIKDAGELPLKNQKVYLNNSSGFSLSNDSGYVYFNLSPGTYSVYSNSVNLWKLTSDSSYSIVLPQDTIKTRYFGFKAVNLKDSIDVIITASPFRCQRVSDVWITLNNLGNTTISGNDTLRLNTVPTYLSSVPAGQNINSATKSWTVASLLPSSSYNILASLQLPNTSIGLDSVRLACVFSAKSIGFPDFKKAYENLNGPVICSYDPNFKSVRSVGPSMDSLVLKDNPLEYTIQFQNTGNDTAYTVTIRDTLNNNLDIKTLTVQAASANVNTLISGNVATFILKDINLVDSGRNERLSHGFVTFTISPKTNLPNNTTIKNMASIYFDFNPAIITNTTKIIYVNQLPNVTNVLMKDNRVDNFQVYPNPARQVINISWELNVHVPHNMTVEILDITGKVVDKVDNITSNHLYYKNNMLSKGLYFVNLKGDDMILGTAKLAIQ